MAYWGDMRRLVVLVLCLALVAAPAAAKGKKKKGPKPWSSPEVAILVPHPVFYNTTGEVLGITMQEFLNTCAMPATNGLDGYVFEVPAEYKGYEAAVRTVSGASAAASDLDIWVFDDACELQRGYQVAGTDEAGFLLKDTAWMVVTNYLGDPNQLFHLELSPN